MYFFGFVKPEEANDDDDEDIGAKWMNTKHKWMNQVGKKKYFLIPISFSLLIFRAKKYPKATPANPTINFDDFDILRLLSLRIALQ